MKNYWILMAVLLFPQFLSAQIKPNVVVMNDQTLGVEQLGSLEKAYGVKIPAGKYWCDSKSGLWGVQGGAAAGFMQPKHCIGKLSPQASNGNSGVFINGRQTGIQEAVWWASLLGSAPIPGQYALDAYGTFSGVNAYTGIPFAINVVQAAQSYGKGGGWSQGGSIHRSFATGIGSGSQGGCNYVIGSDFSYSGPGC
ncbi:MAG: hypothetical protein HY540_08345 [Deltaproteobacteria bacterium]|nr:hypothetical protein [Deltaproteobacteria bacterium]